MNNDNKLSLILSIVTKYKDPIVRTEKDYISEEELKDITYFLKGDTEILSNKYIKLLSTLATIKLENPFICNDKFDCIGARYCIRLLKIFNCNSVDEFKQLILLMNP